MTTLTPPTGHRFPTVYCSQCGGQFGPGNAGFSHCEDHVGKSATLPPLPEPCVDALIAGPNGSEYRRLSDSCDESSARDSIKQMHAHAASEQEPMFYVRLCSNGCYEGPIHAKAIDRVRVESGAWSPLYLGASPVAAPAAPAPEQWGTFEAGIALTTVCGTSRPSAQAEPADLKAERDALAARVQALEADALRWQTFLATRPESTHEVIRAAIDAARGAVNV